MQFSFELEGIGFKVTTKSTDEEKVKNLISMMKHSVDMYDLLNDCYCQCACTSCSCEGREEIKKDILALEREVNNGI